MKSVHFWKLVDVLTELLLDVTYTTTIGSISPPLLLNGGTIRSQFQKENTKSERTIKQGFLVGKSAFLYPISGGLA